LKQRIQTLDGLRFLAAIGVLWIHTWTEFGNPRFYIGKIDLADFLALGANGVDLFFVISGFCMYYFYGRKSDFSYHSFYRFIKKRWVRLSPAFYAATIVYILVEKYVYNNNIDSVLNFFHSLIYLNYIFGQYNTASHFWTLTVEWQFYFTIPFLLIYQNKIGFKKIFMIIFGMILISGLIVVLILKDQSDLYTYTLLFRGVEFGCGVVAARLLIEPGFVLKNRALWLITFIIITYAGRVMISKPILMLSLYYYNFFKLIGFTLMGCGFGGILYMAVTSVKWLNVILGNRVATTMGRISYSFYLFHALVFHMVVFYAFQYVPHLKGIMAPLVVTVISAVILYPVSMLSYHFLEKPFLSIGNLTTK
jgi:peptidoglycan/LPS O-acetylase OafA/YrhL